MDAASLSLAINAKTAERIRDVSGDAAVREEELRKSAQEFESVFIAEMMKHTGLDKALAGDSGFGGEAFSSMLVQTYAEELSKNGGFGLADQIYRQLKDHQS
ncbi:rod-binding protein [Hyphococcus sp.]|uniref:rod-binding protein n=1 Tax=Hyphococcus sp. TaxID=2038636 RepID=UPI0020835337|nr:MAG: hypothetical protein DHS20C04_24840 [Marinicaulis sp.]